MYQKAIENEINPTLRKNGLATKKFLPLIREWEIKNQESAWLTQCHKNGCGRTVIFKKRDDRYYYTCPKCSNTEEVPEGQGKAILGF